MNCDTEIPAAENWITLKLKHDWSSTEFGTLLTSDKITETSRIYKALPNFSKVRLLLSFLCVDRDVFEFSKLTIVDMIAMAQDDNEEWVKITAGLVRKYLFPHTSEERQAFLDEKMQLGIDTITQNVLNTSENDIQTHSLWDGSYCYEYAFLNDSLQPSERTQVESHFRTVSTPLSLKLDTRESSKKTYQGQLVSPTLPQMQRTPSSSQPSSTGARVMMNRSKAAALPPPMKKNLSELSSEIRRKADAGRFKRQRNRISMIDIDEVKQIESEKAQKAEGRKKSKGSLSIKETNDSIAKKSPVNGQRQTVDKKQSGGQDAAPFMDINHNEKLILDYVDGFQLNVAEDDDFQMNAAVFGKARIDLSLQGGQAPFRPGFFTSDTIDPTNSREQEAIAQLASLNPQRFQSGGLMESTERGEPPPPFGFGFGFGDYATQFGAPLVSENAQHENVSRELAQHNAMRNLKDR
uniref:Uncharacterized protein AlNc14C122G6704 n=1 Tax=Albugo laibachii Nc14 TaxID=890382 RepID=F0WJH9_9STRA|nr:conserved hypothetical protein [Albugo laibachii Nc14]|eukprot:CCA21428.1 conserved hypothetical protein [Albugo laibachii Nc14]